MPTKEQPEKNLGRIESFMICVYFLYLFDHLYADIFKVVPLADRFLGLTNRL